MKTPCQVVWHGMERRKHIFLRRHGEAQAPHLVDQAQRLELWKELYPNHPGILMQEHFQVDDVVAVGVRIGDLVSIEAIGFDELV